MARPEIHPTSILQGDIRLADDVVIGPHCVLTAPPDAAITIGTGTRLIGNVYLQGPLVVGERNTLYPLVTLGFPPQDLKWDPEVPGAGLRIGSGNTFREHVTIHRATSHETPTIVGDNNYWMANSHAGHDARIGNNCIFANGVLLAGFVRVDDKVIFGGNATLHQFVRVGRGVMFSGLVGVGLDVPPFFMVTGINYAGSINLVGLRRAGYTSDQIDEVRWVYKLLCREGLPRTKALEVLREKAGSPLIDEYIAFIETSKRGICTARPKAARGTASAD